MPNPAPQTLWARAARVTVLGMLHDQHTLSTFYFGNVNAGVLPSYGDLQSAFDSEIMLNYVNKISQDWSLINIGMTWISHPFVAPAFRTVMTNNQGLVAEAANTPQVCVCFSWETNLAGRRGRGRTFLPGIPITYTQAGKLTVTAQGYYDTIVASMDDKVLTLSGTPYSRFIFSASSSNLVTGAIFGEAIVLGRARPEICTLRRRKVGVGV